MSIASNPCAWCTHNARAAYALRAKLRRIIRTYYTVRWTGDPNLGLPGPMYPQNENSWGFREDERLEMTRAEARARCKAAGMGARGEHVVVRVLVLRKEKSR